MKSLLVLAIAAWSAEPAARLIPIAVDNDSWDAVVKNLLSAQPRTVFEVF